MVKRLPDTLVRWELVVVLSLAVARDASAQTQQTQTVPLSVSAIDKFTVTGLSPLTITVNPVNPTTEFSTTYSITTNSATARRITAKLDSDAPAGVTINVSFESPGGSAVVAAKNLTAAPQNVVTSITHVAASGITITYTVTVTPAVAPTTFSRTVTFTVE